ncbi:hypothetical protein BDW22DRAFT_1340223 [Trametopsis cervina]|nr:hypothetical protein BDW22DRAFT_1340223 [Trametopsis cervina]
MPSDSIQPEDSQSRLPVLDLGSDLPEPPPVVDSIQVQFHPSLNRQSAVYDFQDYQPDRVAGGMPENLDDEPWHPFKSRADFEFASLTQETRMNTDQIKRLLQLIMQVKRGQDISFVRPADVDAAWQRAAYLYPTFTQTTLTVPYDNQDKSVQFHHRPLWDWVLHQVQDPSLASHFHWDAQRVSKYNGSEWVRFYEEPWTADMFWDVQTSIAQIHPEGRPLGIILWADKSKLSTFGSQKGHPIVAQIGNLDNAIRNGGGIGGGRIVGLVPVIEEDVEEQGKKRYIDWKNAIYHAAFQVLLKEIAKHSETGYSTYCGDQILRVLFPFILILAADYEEQTYLALIRGLQGLAPCTICLIPKGKLADLSVQYPERNQQEIERIINKEEAKGQKENILKPMGLRPVKNALFEIKNTDIFRSLSFDRLHAYSLGLFVHLWSLLKTRIENRGRDAQRYFESSMDSVPSWSKLTHFPHAMHMDFSDGSKWADFQKTIVQSCFNLFAPDNDPKTYQLLKVLRKYIECDMYVSLGVQTEETLQDYEQTIQDFGFHLKAYSDISDGDEDFKNWNGIIKAHTHIHATRDIRLKGVMRNMDTRVFEKFHGPLRTAYKLQTNFKDVEKQLGRLDDLALISCDIQAHIDEIDQYHHEQKKLDDIVKKTVQSLFGHVYLGSPQKPETIAAVTQGNADDEGYTHFHNKINKCLASLLHQEYEDGERTVRPGVIKIHNNDTIKGYQYLKVNYESEVTWREVTDTLRCSPMFFGAPRHDTVLIETIDPNTQLPGLPMFGKLVYVFELTYDGKSYALALVQPFHTLPGPVRPVDYDLGLCRVRAHSRKDTCVVPVRSIRRGALLISNADSYEGDHLVVDTLDEDMFLRCMHLFPNRDMVALRRRN